MTKRKDIAPFSQTEWDDLLDATMERDNKVLDAMTELLMPIFLRGQGRAIMPKMRHLTSNQDGNREEVTA